MFSQIQALLQKKFVKDVAWSIAGTLVAALATLFLNTFIGNYYSSGSLGVFSKCFAFYMVLSVAGVWGSTEASVKFTAENHHDKTKLGHTYTAGLVYVLATSIIVTGIATIVVLLFPQTSPGFRTGLLYFFAGVPFFCLNKCLQGTLNGLREMKLLAQLQIIRWVLVIACVYALSKFFNSPLLIGLAFAIAELLLLVYNLLVMGQFASLDFSASELKKNLSSFFHYTKINSWSAIAHEINNNADIIILGFFVSNSDIGYYSLAIFGARSLLMVPSIIQLNFNPLVARLWQQKDMETLQRETIRVRNYSIGITTLLVLVASVGFPVYIHLSFVSAEYEKAIYLFYLMVAGVTVMSVFTFSGAMLSMAGMVKQHLKLVMLNLFVKIALACALSYFFGVYGMAVGISLHYIFIVSNAIYIFGKYLNINLLKVKV